MSMEKIRDWLRENRITEVECLVPDMTGSARGKFIPAHQFLGRGKPRLPESIMIQSVTGEYSDSHWDFVEPTDIIESVDTDDSDLMGADIEDAEDVQTGTFAPGDFEEPTAAVDSIDDIDDLMLPDDVDEVSTKLDLARAFIDMGDNEGARGSLEEVIAEGNEDQKAEAKSLLDQI